MTIFSIWVINKAGGLVYDRTFAPGLPQISQNDMLVLAGTLHGVHAITAQLSPVGGEGGKSEGCEIIESDGVRLIIFLTPTGTKFILLVSPTFPSLAPPPAIASLAPPPAPTAVAVREGKALLGQVYVAYSDYVMKNPFQPLEMPIRSEGFDQKVESLVRTAMSP